MTELLELEGLVAGYGKLAVVRSLDLHVSEGEIVGLFGPNGAGKTTTLLTACGLLPALAGEIRVCGRTLDAHHPSEAARRGVSLVPEDPRALLRPHSPGEPQSGQPRPQGANGPGTRALPRARTSGLEEGRAPLRRPATDARDRAGLAAEPRLLVVDEMSLGLAPLIVQRLLTLLRDVVTRTGTAVLIVEQHVHLALELADRAYVLNHGELVLSGSADELRARRDLLEVSYLGEAAL